MIVHRDPRPGDFVILAADVVEGVSFLQDRVVASRGQLGVVHAVQRAWLLMDTVDVVLVGTGRVVRAPIEVVSVVDRFPETVP